MALKTGIFSLALGALLVGSAASADEAQKLQAPQNTGTQVQAQGFRGNVEQTASWGIGGAPNRDYVRDARYRRAPQPPPPRNQQGSYELKQVQQWVPGGYQQVWVPQDCRSGNRWSGPKCTGGYYDQRWVEGHYETVEQWVWVASPWNRGGWGSPAAYWHD